MSDIEILVTSAALIVLVGIAAVYFAMLIYTMWKDYEARRARDK